jgi:endonuclease YncB( thermonuclease family)
MFHRLYHGHTRRIFPVLIVAAFVAVPLSMATPRGAQAAASPPKGVPAGATAAQVWGYIDGDKFKVRIDGQTEELNTIGADAPETDKGDFGECYAKEASDRVKTLLAKKATIWLEQDDVDHDGKDRLLRYVWVVGDDGAKPSMLNEGLIREGFASYASSGDNKRYDARFKKAQDAAKKAKTGLWGACDGAHDKLQHEPRIGDPNQPAPLGTGVETDGQSITVSDAFFSGDYGFSTPKGGYVFLVITARIENVDDGDHGYEDSRFSARDLDSDATFDDTFTLADQPLGSGELSPGEFVFGTVVLEVQDTSTRIRIKYDPKLMGDGDEAYWLVTR